MYLVRLAALLGLPLLLGACTALTSGGRELPPLPPVAVLGCCWISEERVEFFDAGTRQVVHTVVEVNENRLTVVVLDPTGRRQLTLRYSGDELRELTAPRRWDTRYSHYLLLAIFLHHADRGDWLQHPSPWQVKFVGQVKTLARGDDTIIALKYTAPSTAHARPRTLRFPATGQEMRVRTVRRSAL